MPWFTATDTVILWSTPPVQVQIFSHLSVHYGIWQVLIFIPCRWGKPINIQGSSFLCWSKTITNMNVSFFLLPFLFSFFFAQQQSIRKRLLEKRRVEFLCIHFKRRWWFGTEVYGVIISHLTPCHRHFITVKINRLLSIPKSINDSLSFWVVLVRIFFFFFFFLCCTGNTNELSVFSLAPLWKCGHFIL